MFQVSGKFVVPSPVSLDDSRGIAKTNVYIMCLDRHPEIPLLSELVLTANEAQEKLSNVKNVI